MIFKKFIAVLLSIVTSFSLIGCNKTENTSETKEETQVSSEIVGVWVVESRENINGLTKDSILETWYPIGAEFEFTSDGEYIDKGIVMSYNILDDNTLEIEGDLVLRVDYEISDDTLKMCFESNSYSVTFKRK